MSKMQWLKKTIEIFAPKDCAEITEYCKKNWEEDVRHVIKTADDACENTFLFDFRWDMERTWKPVHFENEINWSLIPFGDREFLWQFNRHRFLLCLSQAYAMTGDEKYALNYVRLLSDWIERAEEGENIDLGPWRTLETGIRAEMWLRSLPEITKSEAADETFLIKVYISLKRHQKRLAEHFLPHKYISNWGTLESCGLLLLSVVLPDSEEYQALAIQRLVDCANTQVLQDGTQWEQSPMYHNEVYHCFLTAWYYGMRAGVSMPQVIRDTVKKMAYVNYVWKKPSHIQFGQGDSDASDLRDQITMGAFVLRDCVLKSGGYEILDYESAWRFGYEACLEYESWKPEKPEFISAELPFSGNYYMRSDWSENANLLHFRCGETGGGHGHADKLHVDLDINGESILVDSGRFTYVEGKERSKFKEAAAHNVVTVDEQGFAECETAWIYKSLCSCMKQQYFDGTLGSFVEGSHLGYWQNNVLVNRKIVWIKPEIYVICDDFWAHGTHKYDSYLHFEGQGTATMEKGVIHFCGLQTEAYIQLAEADDQMRLLDTEESWHYNEKHPNQTYCGSTQADGFYRRITLINGGKKGEAKPLKFDRLKLYSEVNQRFLDITEAEGLRILHEDKEYILYLCHKEVLTPTDILRWGNCLGYGKAVLFDRTKEKSEVLTGEILAW